MNHLYCLSLILTLKGFMPLGFYMRMIIFIENGLFLLDGTTAIVIWLAAFCLFLFFWGLFCLPVSPLQCLLFMAAGNYTLPSMTCIHS